MTFLETVSSSTTENIHGYVNAGVCSINTSSGLENAPLSIDDATDWKNVIYNSFH